MLCRIEDHLAIADNIFHELQDYGNKIRQLSILRSFQADSLLRRGKARFQFFNFLFELRDFSFQFGGAFLAF